MLTMRHVASLGLVALLVIAFWGAWLYWPDFTRWEPIRPYRGVLVEWRLPILSIGGFLFLTLVERLYGKTIAHD